MVVDDFKRQANSAMLSSWCVCTFCLAIGLFGQWFDACIAWVITTDRIHVFDFTQPYLEAPLAFFYVKKGSSFDGRDLAGKTIGKFSTIVVYRYIEIFVHTYKYLHNVPGFFTGFVEGWATDEKCLARQTQLKNRVLPAERVKYYELIQEGIDRLNDDTVRTAYNCLLLVANLTLVFSKIIIVKLLISNFYLYKGGDPHCRICCLSVLIFRKSAGCLNRPILIRSCDPQD